MHITAVREECPGVKTFQMDGVISARPGQFVMVWVPGADEFPMSISGLPELALTVKAVGPGTEALHRLKPGAVLGIRGPYGNGYSIHERVMGPILLVGGGTGIASLAPYAEYLAAKGINAYFSLGAKTCQELFFRERLEKALPGRVHPATDDGSACFKGLVTELASELLEKYNIKGVAACGPEKMMVRMFQMCRERGLPFEASMERYMKCGVGICDSCAFGPYRVCKDGPVFRGEQLAGVEDFGKWTRSPSGKKVRL